eukprot:6415408-Heterocapsa_arctica.AAC.1
MVEADGHRFKVDVDDVAQHRSAPEEPPLRSGYPLIEDGFPPQPGRVRHQAIVGVHDGERASCRSQARVERLKSCSGLCDSGPSAAVPGLACASSLLRSNCRSSGAP